MPRKPLRPKKKKHIKVLSKRQIYHIIRGFTYDFLPGPSFSSSHYAAMTGDNKDVYPFASLSERRDTWLRYREYFLSFVGLRTEDADDPSWHPELKFCERPAAQYDYEFEAEFGLRQKIEDLECGPETEVKPDAIFKELESEETYLSRHGLLLPGEARRRAIADERAAKELADLRCQPEKVVSLDEKRQEDDIFSI